MTAGGQLQDVAILKNAQEILPDNCRYNQMTLGE
jgi:hypothetical protein